MERDLDALLVKARAGDQNAREQLLQQLKPFILKQATIISGRHLQWGHDDELSIALIGLNEAIDSFDPARRVPFTSFARMVIRSRLLDHWRQEQRQTRELVLLSQNQPEEGSLNYAESRAAWENFQEKELARERAEEIARLNQLLAVFDIRFKELPRVCPKHQENRRQCQRAAQEVAQDPDLIGSLLETRKLPLKNMTDRLGINRKTLERGRKYIIAVALMLHYRDEFPHLGAYLQLPQ